MITLNKLFQPTFASVEYLSRVEGNDEATLSDILRFCVTDRQFSLYEIRRDENIVGALIIKTLNRILYVWLMGAEDFFSWGEEGGEALEKEARLLGCTKMKFYGRLGWLRKPPQGWKAEAIEFVRDVP